MRNSNKLISAAFAIACTTPASAGYVTNPPNSSHGIYTDQDTRMICGDMTSAYGTGHAFSREMYGGVYKIGVTKYASTSAGVNSSTTTHILDRSYLDFTVVGADPAVGTNPTLKNRNYIFGGNLPSGGSNEFFKYDASGFSGPSLMGGGLISGRAGMIGTPVGNNGIFLFGGYSGAMGSGTVVKESFLFDRVSETFSPREPMPVGLQNAKALPSGPPTGVSWVYVVGGSTIAGSQSNNRKIYRYDITANKWIVLQDGAGNDLQIPGTKTMEIASVQGAMLVLTQSEDDASMIAYRVTHPSTGPGMVTYGGGASGTLAALGTGKGASLTATPYNVPLRARSGFALLRCSPDAWVIGGTYGHGPSFSDRSKFVDKLTRY